jgi:glycosyltransferase involved in cell wall biosynthesis
VTTPLLSVVIPTWNRAHIVGEAVASALDQGPGRVEVIVVDDGSTDRTAEIISRLPYDVRYVRQDNAGPAAARNRGIRDASGELIAFLDVDDLWPDNNLTRLVDELVLHPELDVVYGYGQEMGKHPENDEYEYFGNPKDPYDYHISSAVYRKSAFEKAGLFDTTMRFGEDNDWFARASESNLKMKRVEEVTLLIRRRRKARTWSS